MANPTTSPTRLSPAELRRRLLAPPTDAAAPVVVEEALAPPPTRPQHRRDSSRFGGATQTAIDLDALALEVGMPLNPRHTPVPDGRIDSSHLRKQESPPAAPPMPGFYSGGSAHGEDETAQLRTQNAELTRIIEEMRPIIEEATNQEVAGKNQQREFQDLMAEKDLTIEDLQLRLKSMEEKLANVPAPTQPKTRDELEEWNDELEQEASKQNQLRRTLDDDRKQLREDEESLEKQMREMECSMARERAMMARQETELKRLSAEIQHELELLQRGDGTLREQLAKFQRRHQEVLSRALGGGPPPSSGPIAAAPAPSTATPAAHIAKDSGLFRRIFRSNK